MEGEYIVIGGWPVQFLPPTGPLVDEALGQAVETDVEGVRARVFSAEHLAAIALETGRAKDKARLLQPNPLANAGSDVPHAHSACGVAFRASSNGRNDPTWPPLFDRFSAPRAHSSRPIAINPSLRSPRAGEEWSP